MTHNDWWSFSLEPDRADPGANRLEDEAGQPLVGAAPGERSALDYAGYLGLPALLGAGTPASTVPDERAFVTVHQLCEVVFKQMTFDLAVVTATLERLRGLEDDPRTATALAEGEVDDERSGAAAFWRPAITAGNRLRHAAQRLLPPVMELMGRNGEDDVLFSRVEFAHFRPHLEPSSGFQAAQLRLIQRALGKGPLLDLRVFPGDAYGRHYTGSPCGHVSLADPVVLRDGAETASPPDGHPSSQAARLDAAAHDLLASLPSLGRDLPPPPDVARIHDGDVDRAVSRFRATLGPEALEERRRPARRRRLPVRPRGRRRRRERAARHPRRRPPRRLLPPGPGAPERARPRPGPRGRDRPRASRAVPTAASSRSIGGTVRRHVSDGSGTGGGGMPYLVTSQRYLLPLFPALVAWQDLEG